MRIAGAIGFGVLCVGIGLTKQYLPALSTDENPASTASNAPTRTDCLGDPLPAGALSRLGTVRLRYPGLFLQGGVEAVAFSQDGKSIFTTSAGNPLRHSDVATGKLLRQFGEGSPASAKIVPSPDGRTLAVSNQNSVSLWDSTTGKLLRQWRSYVLAMVFSSDGMTLTAACQDQQVRIWEVTSGNVLRSQAISATSNVAVLSANGKTLASVNVNNNNANNNKSTVQLWDVTTGKKLHELSPVKDSSFSQVSSSLAFSPDGSILATASASSTNFGGVAEKIDGAVHLWDVATGKHAGQLGLDMAGTSCVAFSPDGKLLATGSGGGPIRLWDVATRKEIRCCQGYRTHVLSLTFSPGGTRLASGANGNDQTARVWDTATGKEITPSLEGHVAPVLSVAFTPDGKSLVSGGRDGKVILWDEATGRQRLKHLEAGDFQSPAALSADGTTIASIGNVFSPNGGSYVQSVMSSPTIIRLWDTATGQERRQFPGTPGCAQFMALSPNGKTLLTTNFQWSGGQPGIGTSLWHLADGKQPAHTGISNAMFAAFSPNSSTIAEGSTEGALYLSDASTGKKIDHCQAHTGSLQGVVFSPDGWLLATAGDSPQEGSNQNKLAIRLWQMGSGKKRALEESRMIIGHESQIFALAFSPDSRTIASAGENGIIYVWETISGKERCRFTGHHGQVWCLAFAPDGHRIASGSNDTTILVWDVTGRLEHGQPRPAQLTAEAVEKIWADLASSDARQAGQAIWKLAAEPEPALTFLKKKLVPIPVVKGREQLIAKLIKELDDDTFRVRRKAMTELRKLGEAAEPAIRRLLESPASAEVKIRAKHLLAFIQKKKALPSTEDYRRVRALEVVEQCNTATARQLLESLAQGEPSAPLTREAQASLSRLSRRAVQ